MENVSPARTLWTPQDVAPIAKHFAEHYDRGIHRPLSVRQWEAMNDVTLALFRAMPVEPEWCCRGEPYENFENMAIDVAAGRFRMRDYDLTFRSRVFGPCYKQFRAVHDYYGHFLANNPFGLIGELSAYGVHAAQFPPECHPAIWNELVHINAYKEHFGRAPREDKLVRYEPQE